MNVLDKILLEWAWQCPKGYPDVDSEADMQILESVLLTYLTNEELAGGYSNLLNYSELKKARTPDRGIIFYNKVKEGQPFLTANGEEVAVEFLSDELAEKFANKNYSGLKNKTPIVKDASGTEYSIQDFIKTSEFGGKQKGASLTKESGALSELDNTVKQILSTTGQSSIVVRVAGKVYEGITGAVNVAGTPKADFALAAGDTAKIFISHKDGNKPTDFLRWSGISSIKDDPAVASFVEAIKEENGGVFEPKQTYTRPITEEGFAHKAIYGKNFGSEDYGVDNVQCVIQGSVTLTPADGVYELGGTGNIWTGEIPEGMYAPVFFAQYRSGRRDLGLDNCESLVTPASKITRNTKSI